MNVENRNAALAACRQWLRPVIRLLLRAGVMQRDFAELAKELYVEVATHEYGLQGRPTNVARTALLTGLDRKEVRRLRELLAGEDNPQRGRQDRLTRVLSAWHQNETYSRGGKPLPLPMVTEPERPSFTALVHEFGGDVPTTTVLKELKRAGVVGERDGKLYALKRYYMPAIADPSALQRAGSVLEDLGNTVVHNLTPPAPSPEPRFEGRATNTMIASAALPEFRHFLEERGQRFLEDIDAWLTAHEAGTSSGEAPLRVGVGVYAIQNTIRRE